MNAREAFEQAAQLVKERKYDEALAVPMLKSDRNLIMARIADAKSMQINSTKEN